MHHKADRSQRLACGGHVEEAENPLMRTIRRLDKLFDQQARGKAKLLRS